MATKSRSNNKSDARKGSTSSARASSELGIAGAQTGSADEIGLEAMSQASVMTQFAQQAAVLQDWSHQQPSNARLQEFAAGKAGTPAHQAAATAVLSAKADGATTGQAVAKAISGGSSTLLNAGSGARVVNGQSLSEYAHAQQALSAAQAGTRSTLEQLQSTGASGRELAEARAVSEALSRMQSESWSLATIQKAADGDGFSVAQQSAARAVVSEMESVSRSSGTGSTYISRNASVGLGGSGLVENGKLGESAMGSGVGDGANRKVSNSYEQNASQGSSTGTSANLTSSVDFGRGTIGEGYSSQESSSTSASVSHTSSIDRASASEPIQSALQASIAEARAVAQALEAMEEQNWSAAHLQAAARGEGYSVAEQAAAARVLDVLDRNLENSGSADVAHSQRGVGAGAFEFSESVVTRSGFGEVTQERPDGVVETHSRTLSIETDKGRAELLADVVRSEDSVSAANALVQLRDNAIQMEERVPDLAAAIYNSVPPADALATAATLAHDGGQVDAQSYVDSKFPADVKESAGADFREAAEQLRAEQGPRADVAAEKLEAFAEALKTGDAPAIASAQSEMASAVAGLVHEVARESAERLAEELPKAPEGDIQRIAIHEESKETYPDGQQTSQSQTTAYAPPSPEQVVESAAARTEAASDAMQVAQVLRDAGHDVAADALEQVAMQARTGSAEQIATAQQEVLTAFESEFGRQGPEAEPSREQQKDSFDDSGRAREFAEAEKADIEHEAEMSMGE